MKWSLIADIGQCIVTVVLVIVFAMVLILATTATRPVPVNDAGETYERCEAAHPYRDDLQKACRQGADFQSDQPETETPKESVNA
jgi:hypothetical protein